MRRVATCAARRRGPDAPAPGPDVVRQHTEGYLERSSRCDHVRVGPTHPRSHDYQWLWKQPEPAGPGRGWFAPDPWRRTLWPAHRGPAPLHPGSCSTRWCRRHRHMRLAAEVGPAGHGRTWSRSHNRGATRNPGSDTARHGGGRAARTVHPVAMPRCRSRRRATNDSPLARGRAHARA